MNASTLESTAGDDLGREEKENGEEHNVEANTVYRELARGDDSNFHDSIKAKDWDKLRKLLKKYKSHYYKKKRIQAREMEKEKLQQEEEEQARKRGEEKEKSDLTKFQRIRRNIKSSLAHREQKSVTVARKVLPRSVTKKIFVDPADIISPLLMVDSDGRSPLHLACIYKAPETLILDLLDAENKATIVKDHAYQLPLHCAIQSSQYDHIIERMIKANPNALKSKDNCGRTPIRLAVELARRGKHEDATEDLEFLWISPTSKEERSWQFEQEKRWSKVNCLLKELINRRKVVIPSEHGLILDALEEGADPTTITNFVSTSHRYLMMDDELAGTAIGLCVERHYNLDTLVYLMDNCREKTTVVTDIVQKALKAHYILGCYPLREGLVPFGKGVIDWAKKREEKRTKKKTSKKKTRDREKKKKKKTKKEVKECSHKSVRFEDEPDKKKDVESTNKQWIGMKSACKEWWEVLNHLIFYSAYGRDYRRIVKPKTFHLLHAALSSPMTPPSLIHLLLIVYPEAIHEKCPMYNVLPVHISCTRWRYNIIHPNGDTSSLDQVLLHLFESDIDQLYQRHRGSLPIHMALFGGQFWAFIKSLVSTERKLLGMRDAQSKLFPFQIAALPIRFRNIQLLMRYQFNPTLWREMSFLEKKAEYERVVDEQETRQLSTIFELLRRYPDAVENRHFIKKPTTSSQTLRSLSELSKHYLSWVYSRNSKGGYQVRYNNLTALRNSIIKAEILPELDQWWIRLKECIWKNSHRDIPRTNDYLLHSALLNCETPPLVTELLIQLFPSSTAQPIPGTTTFPLHIAAGTMSYQRQQFEIPYGMNNLCLVLKAYKQAARFRSNGRLPLHICLARGKSWEEVRPLVMVDPSSLKVHDEQTGLAPFELMATFKPSASDHSLWYSTFTERRVEAVGFYELSTQEKVKALSAAEKEKELDQLTCIFELIRHKPSILSLRFSGSIADSDDGSTNSLHSFVDDGYETRGREERWEMLDDCSNFQTEGNSRELISPLQPNKRSIHSLCSDDDGVPSLITPLDPSINRSLSAYLLEKSSSNISSSTPKSAESSRKEMAVEKNLPERTKPKFTRRGTKAAIFDFHDIDLSAFDALDDEDSSEFSGEKDIVQRERPHIPVEPPDLG